MPSDTLPPPETFSFGYSSLFQVRVLHHYFLDIGNDAFNAAAPTPAQAAALQVYDMRRFWRIVPSPATQELLRRQRLRFYATADGFRVLAEGQKVKRGAPESEAVFSLRVLLDETADFSFLIYPTDPDFLRYTRLPDDSLELVPSPPLKTEPLGRMLVLYNTSDSALGGTNLATTQPYHSLLPGLCGSAAAPVARPLAVLVLRHGNSVQGAFPDFAAATVSMVTTGRAPVAEGKDPATGAPEQYIKGLKNSGLTYLLELPTRRTAWIYQKPGAAPVMLATWYPLTLHGRIPVSIPDPASATNPPIKLPNPAMNTTRPHQGTPADPALPSGRPTYNDEPEPAYVSIIY